jgi:DNA polymerase III epsilon subunit family exonuclease
MSVGGFTVVVVTRPTAIARAMGGHGYGSDGAPLARPELALVKPTAADGTEAGSAEARSAESEFAEARSAESEFAGLEFAGLEFAGLEFAGLEFAVIDLETTGWSPGVAAITEIAAVRVRGGRRQGEFASLVNPGVPVPQGIEDLTGISDWMLAAAPRLPAVLPGLLDFADGCVLVAHNAPFDVGFLRAACSECGLAWPRFTVLDTVMLARQLMDPDEVPDCKLGTLAGFFRARTAPSHRALADARATADVLGWLIRRLTHHGVQTLDQLRAWPDVLTSSPT